MADITFTRLDTIVVAGGRQRQQFDQAALFELETDIEANGLIYPLVLSGNDLLAGERRLRAISNLADFGKPIRFLGKLIPLGTVPTIQLTEATELTKAQVEYSENEYRTPLTWQERAKAQAALARLRELQAAESDACPPTAATLAAELSGVPVESVAPTTISRVRTNLNVAPYLDDPEVAKAATAKEALKIIKRREQTANNLLAAADYKQAAATLPLNEIHLLINGSALDAISCHTGRPIDLIISDPPYGIDAHLFGDGSTNVKGQHQYDDSYDNWVSLMRSFVGLAWGVTADPGAMLLFCDFDRFHELKELCEQAGWYVHRTPLIWSKDKNGLVPLVGESFARSYEIILYATKGKFQLQETKPDVIVCRPDENLGHGAQKPVALYAELLRRMVPSGSLVADFFAGSGPLLPAAHAHACKSILVELDPAHFGIIARRFRELENAPNA